MGRVIGIATRTATKLPMIELERAEVTVDGGVQEDSRGRPGGRQVLVMSKQAWEAACSELGESLPWTMRRGNLLVDGVDLAGSVGSRLRIGRVLLEIREEAEPCQVMDRQRPGLRAALAPDWRGGVLARVRMSGVVEIGTPVALEAS